MAYPPQTTGAPAAHDTQPPDDPIQTVALVSLGCPKNLVDSEKMLGLMAEEGLVPINDESAADAIVINTCGFLEASKQESLEQITLAADRKQTGSCKRLVVAGCLVQRHRAKLLEWCPQIDALIGVFDRDRITAAVRGDTNPHDDTPSTTDTIPVYSSIAANATVARAQRSIQATGYYEDDSARLRLTPRHYAYLRISEGCNQNCAFCTIPSIRGKMRSKPVERIVAEARELIHDGVFELNLIGQDTTSFGHDIGYKPGLVGMLTALDKAVREELGPDSGWVRLMYAYPSSFSDEVIDAIANLDSMVKYLDMPIQHINDHVLDQMRRNTSRKQIETLLQKLRDRVPNIALRTTLITGFPGETEAQHQELVEFVREMRFDALGVFPYSTEPGTPAATLHAQGQAVPDEVAQERQDELMTTQQEVAFTHNEQLVQQGASTQVLIDAPLEDDDAPIHTYPGRSPHQAPQIDGITFVQSSEDFAPGELVACKITGADGYDLIAQPANETARSKALPILS